jgi:hypothetical protein
MIDDNRWPKRAATSSARGSSENFFGGCQAVNASRRHPRSDGYRLGQRARKKVEEVFAWCKTVAGLAKARHEGRWKILPQMQIAAAACNLVRMRNLPVG